MYTFILFLEDKPKISLTLGYYISVLDDLNNFTRNRVRAKSNDFKSLFGNEKPYINTAIHFDLSNSSDAVLPTLPNIALTERKKDILLCVI